MEDKLETCKNCAWWWPNRSLENFKRNESFLRSGLDPQNTCESPVSGDRTSRSGFSSYDDVYTGPDFGCIHWQAVDEVN